jgi:hypothetical protein
MPAVPVEYTLRAVMSGPVPLIKAAVSAYLGDFEILVAESAANI